MTKTASFFSTIAIIIFLGFSSTLNAQTVEITGYGGFMLNTHVRTQNGEVNFKDGGVYGASLGFLLPSGQVLELDYFRNSVDAIDQTYWDHTPFEATIEGYFIGAYQDITGDKVRPFAGVAIGMYRYNAKTVYDKDHFFFAANIKAGAKIDFSDRVGLRLQARLGLPMVFGGIGIFCGTGGCGGGANFWVPMVHGDFTGGLVIKLGDL